MIRLDTWQKERGRWKKKKERKKKKEERARGKGRKKERKEKCKFDLSLCLSFVVRSAIGDEDNRKSNETRPDSVPNRCRISSFSSPRFLDRRNLVLSRGKCLEDEFSNENRTPSFSPSTTTFSSAGKHFGRALNDLNNRTRKLHNFFLPSLFRFVFSQLEQVVWIFSSSLFFFLFYYYFFLLFTCLSTYLPFSFFPLSLFFSLPLSTITFSNRDDLLALPLFLFSFCILFLDRVLASEIDVRQYFRRDLSLASCTHGQSRQRALTVHINKKAVSWMKDRWGRGRRKLCYRSKLRREVSSSRSGYFSFSPRRVLGVAPTKPTLRPFARANSNKLNEGTGEDSDRWPISFFSFFTLFILLSFFSLFFYSSLSSLFHPRRVDRFHVGTVAPPTLMYR